MRRIPTKDALLIVLVTAVTVMTDLAIAVLIGVILSALFYAWNATRGAWVEIDAEGGKIYTLQDRCFLAGGQLSGPVQTSAPIPTGWSSIL